MMNLFDSTPPDELFLVGEHTEDPNQLLLRGSDGNFYDYEVTWDCWIDVDHTAGLQRHSGWLESGGGIPSCLY
jgi:hypothetical protein